MNRLTAEDIILGDTLIVTGEEHRFLALDQLREMPEDTATFLLEPVGRNTPPAHTFAAMQAVENGEDPISRDPRRSNGNRWCGFYQSLATNRPRCGRWQYFDFRHYPR